MHFGLWWGTEWKLGPAFCLQSIALGKACRLAVGHYMATAGRWDGKGCSDPHLWLLRDCGAKVNAVSGPATDAHKSLGETKLWLSSADGPFWHRSVGKGPALLMINKWSSIFSWKLGVLFIILSKLLFSTSYGQHRQGQTFLTAAVRCQTDSCWWQKHV